MLDGRVALFELLMRRHHERLSSAVRSIVRDGTEAEDVMQQAFVAAYAHLRRFDGRGWPPCWPASPHSKTAGAEAPPTSATRENNKTGSRFGEIGAWFCCNFRSATRGAFFANGPVFALNRERRPHHGTGS